LSVWQEAIRFADLVYELTGDFPGEERFGLTNQMQCAAVSISSNIAEGSSGASRTDFARFVEIATGSLFEVASTTTKRRGFLPTRGGALLFTGDIWPLTKHCSWIQA
jgi:S23 ribosomal protein.